MTPEQLAAIERLRELMKHVLPLNWQVSETNSENVLNSRDVLVAECCSDDDAVFIVSLCNGALPLIEALAAENERLRTERDALQARIEAMAKKSEDDKVFVANAIEDRDCYIEIRNALQARVDAALFELHENMLGGRSERVFNAIEILKGEQDV